LGRSYGPEGTGHLTDNGERLLNLCAENVLRVGGSLFRHKYIHTYTGGLGAFDLDRIATSEAALRQAASVLGRGL